MPSNEDVTGASERLSRKVADDLARLRMLLLDAEDALSGALAHLRGSSRSLTDRVERDLNAIRAIRTELEAGEPPTADPLKGAVLDALTHRERDVAILLARGLTTHQIAQQLVISPATVRVHVEHILAKLELHTRVQLAALMANQQLPPEQ